MKIQKEVRELQKLWHGFWSSRVVLTANNLRIFDYLQTSITAEEAAGLIEADTRSTEILLNALTGLGLVRKMSGKYQNAAMAKRFLVTGSPYYQGDMLHHATQIARELGVVYVNLPEGCASAIPEMAPIEVNGETGVVRLVSNGGEVDSGGPRRS